MNTFIKISTLAIAAAVVGVSAQAADLERIDAAAMEVQGGPIAAPVLKSPGKSEQLVGTSRAAVKAEQARAWAAGELDYAYAEVNGGALPRGSSSASEMRMAKRNAR